MSFTVTEDFTVTQAIEKAKRNGYDRIRINVTDINNYTDTIYEVFYKFQKLPNIDSNGVITVDIVEDSPNKQYKIPSTIAEARELLTRVFNKMLDNICSSGDYAIPIQTPVFTIMKYYPWFDFNGKFIKRGYNLSIGYKLIKSDYGDRLIQYKCIKRILRYDDGQYDIRIKYGTSFDSLLITTKDHNTCTVRFNLKETHRIGLFREFLSDMKITDYQCGEVGWIFKSYDFEGLDILPILWFMRSGKFLATRNRSIDESDRMFGI